MAVILALFVGEASPWALLHVALMVPLCLYGLHRVVTLVRLTRRARTGDERGAPLTAGRPGELPRVLVQLPLYNERAVAVRVIRAAAALDWPPERLEIQVLDDSEDETRELVDREVRRLRAQGVSIRALRRAERQGFKAGALAHGLACSDAPFVAVFDADFVPRADFLRRVMGDFEGPNVALVQARWGHLDRERGPLTRAQATLLDGHFSVEHAARFRSGLWFNFNGTAGVWRRVAIEAGGGWQGDTLTEDLDLSYRTQLAGWRFVYRDDVEVPAELPWDLAAFLNQQHRWAKGSVQVLRKLGARIAQAQYPWRARQEALVHLAANGAYPWVLLLALVLPISGPTLSRQGGWLLGAAFVACLAAVACAYWIAGGRVGRSARQRLLDVPLALALGVGMSLRQTLAVLSGLGQRVGEFVRTPKQGGRGRLYRSRLPLTAGAELLVAAWLSVGVFRSIQAGAVGAVPFGVFFAAGFGWVGALALWERLRPGTGDLELIPPALGVREDAPHAAQGTAATTSASR